jgi:hypothetical protein
MSTTISLDGSDWAPELLQKPPVASFASAQFRADQRRSAGPSALLGIAAIACTAGASDARTTLQSDFDLPKARARDSVKVGVALCDDFGVSNTALGYLTGVKISKAQQTKLIAMLAGGALQTGASPTIVSQAAVERAVASKAIGRLVRKAVKSDDRPSQAVSAAVLASLLDGTGARLSAPLLTEGLAHTFMGPRKPSLIQRASDRLLAAAYAMSGLSTVGLDLGSERWLGAPGDWRYRAAPMGAATPRCDDIVGVDPAP